MHIIIHKSNGNELGIDATEFSVTHTGDISLLDAVGHPRLIPEEEWVSLEVLK